MFLKIVENTTYKQIKDNIAVILLFPAFLGSIWQVIELSRISTSFIRFFSASQLVSDGTLILFILVFAYFGLRILRHQFKDNPTIFDSKSYDIEVCKKSRNINIAILLLTGHAFYFALLPAITDTVKTQKLSPLLFLALLPMTMIVFVLFISSLVTIIVSFGFKMPFKNNEDLSKAINAFFGFLIFLAGLKILLFTITAFHKSFLLPDNVKNTEYIKCIIQKNNPSASDLELLYFNDKYIFIEFKKDTLKQIEILSFDSFLQYTSCDSLQRQR